MRFKIGIDVGGTFTDFLLADEQGAASVYKILSTPDDPSRAVMTGLQAMARDRGMDLASFLGNVDIIVHGTTVTTNAVLTGNVAPTGLLTTAGFRDALEMRRGIREVLYDNRYRAPEPLVPRDLRVPVEERVDYAGVVVTPLKMSDVDAGIALFQEDAPEAVAICFLHAHACDEHEKAAADRVRERMPNAYVSVSSEVLPQIRFYERVSTTVLNACVGPILRRYVDTLVEKLRQGGLGGVLLIMQSNGGVTTPAAVTGLAAGTLLSGPSAAPIAGIAYTGVHGDDSFITVDMGGTSFDTALIKDATPVVTTFSTVDRRALALPMMDIHTIGAGGGSIAWIDQGGLLRMGPRSAGARPGPVCYGFGGDEPTCTDANLILGFLDPDYFAGGAMHLDVDAARTAISERIAGPLGLDPVEAAHGMFHVMNVTMASAIREISVQKGYDPREFPLVCAGGAGPIHAAMIARELDITRIIVPRESSIFCAAGMLLSDLKHDFVRTYPTLLRKDVMDPGRMNRLARDMEAEGRGLLTDERITPKRQLFRYSLDLRYVGQYHEVNVDIAVDHLADGNDEAMRAAFHAAHDRLYGYSLEEAGRDVELVNIRLTAIGLTEKPSFKEEQDRGPDPAAAFKTRRPVFLPSEGDFGDVDVFDGAALRRGNRLSGPAIIEHVNTTVFVPPGWSVACDPFGSAVLTADRP